MDKKPCPFCGVESDYQEFVASPAGDDFFHGHSYDCAGCGRYVLGPNLSLDWESRKSDEKFKIACLVREKKLASDRIPYGVLEDDYQPSDYELPGFVKMWWRIGELLAEFPKPTEIIDRALLNLSRLVNHPMDTISLRHDEPRYLLFCPSSNFQMILNYMDEMGLIRKQACTSSAIRLLVAPGGWQRISELQSRRIGSNQAFVAMWFADETDSIYREGIEPAVNSAGFDCKRIDNKEHNNKICDEIIAEIRKSRFVVADFTAGLCMKCDDCEHNSDCRDNVRPRGGVYFEAGFALGLGIPVIWTVRSDQIDGVHFDTRQYNHIVYDTPEDLKQKLYNRIAATIH